MTKILGDTATEIQVESNLSNNAFVLKWKDSKMKHTLLCFTGLTILTVCFIYSLHVDQFLLSNKIAAYIIFAAWIFMKTGEQGTYRYQKKG